MLVGFGPERAALAEQAQHLGLDVLFTGPLQHRHLRHLWALADVSVVPSVFPEAFGMVAAEAAATGCSPLVARHSGLAEVAAGIEGFLPAHLHLISFERADVADLRRRLDQLLDLGPEDRALWLLVAGPPSRGCGAGTRLPASWWAWPTRDRMPIRPALPPIATDAAGTPCPGAAASAPGRESQSRPRQFGSPRRGLPAGW